MDIAGLLLILIYSTPVSLAALGETVAQKSGVINIGLEGMMLMGAYAGAVTSLSTGSPGFGLLAAASVGLCLALVSGAFTVSLAADQVVVGTALNLLALGLTGTMFRARFGESGKLLSVPRLPAWHGLDPLLAFMLFSIPLIWWLLGKTAWGLAVRSVGEYPKAGEASGFSITKLRLGAVAIGGIYAGLAGAYLSLGITGSFAENMTAGRGFVAIAMVTFGRWRPLWVCAAAAFVGYLNSLQFTLQVQNSKIPFQLFAALPYAVALVVLVIAGKGTVAPQALGTPYRRER